MLEYIGINGYTNASLYAEENNCSHYIATRELTQFVAEDLIQQIGKRNHMVYQLKLDKIQPLK